MNKIFLTRLALVLGAATTVVSCGVMKAQAPDAPGKPAPSIVALSSLDLSRGLQSWDAPQVNKIGKDKPLSVNGKVFESGYGAHSEGRLLVRLDGNAERFTASVGVDDSGDRKGDKGSVEFRVIGDDKLLWQSGLMRQGQPAKSLDVDVKGVKYLTLETNDGGDGVNNDYAVWGNAFFQGVTGPIAVVERLPQDLGKIVPAAAWRDTKGELIQAHGGGVLLHNGSYYWYGEDRSNGYIGIGVSAYKSQDLVNWEPLGVVLPKSAYDKKWAQQNINERPKVLYNPRTRKFVMWFHYDRSGYKDSRAGVAIADSPDGPFRYQGEFRPIEESTYRDQTVFADDDGTAYAIYSGEGNATMHITRLNDEWTAPQMPMVEGKTWSRNFVKGHREAPAVWKHNGKYYIITSGTSGWNPNPARYAVADNMLGPWTEMGNPFVGSGREITFGSQSTHVLPLGGNRFVYMGDRWNKSNLKDARYVWLPFEIKPDGTFSIEWRDSWKPTDFGFTPPVPLGKVALSSLDLSRGFQSWGRPAKDKNVSGTPLTLGGKVYATGYGAHGEGRLFVGLGGNAARFTATVGVDDAAEKQGSVEFRVLGDGQLLWQSGLMKPGQTPKTLDVNLKGVKYLTLESSDGDDGISNDHANWAGAFFEGVTGPIAVVERLPQDLGKIVPAAAWRDTKGELIQAHGGGVLLHNGSYYWYGEDRSNGYIGIGVSAYKSQDLVNWEPLGVVLPKSAYDKKWAQQNINERPKVLYNPRTRKFVMWFHYDRSGYKDSRAGVAIADSPDGPFRYQGEFRPIEESTYRDQTVFADDDGTAYAIYSGEGNATMHITRLNDEWTAPQMPMVEGKTWSRNFVKGHREAPAVWKHNGKYYIITSGTSGWNPNPARYAVADNMLGPWKDMGDPFVGSGRELTFGSQSTHVLPLGGNRFVYMGDRWNPSNLRDSRYVWLPFEMKPDGNFNIVWRDSWKPTDFGFFPVAAAPQEANGPLRYRLAQGSENWSEGKKEQIVAAMDEAVAFYNKTGTFDKQIVASYNENVPTADGNFNGNIRFGKQISSRTALHEIGHILGIGTVGNWQGMSVDGKWTGKNAIAQLREFDGPEAVLYADRQHFWPYGLNFPKEDVPDARRRHVLMVAALRADLGLDGDKPFVLAKGTNQTPPTLAGRDFLTLPGAEWKLAFADEFDGDNLDESKWSIGLPWGGTDGTGRHHNDGYASYIMDDDVAVRDGLLHLTTQRRKVTDKVGKKHDFTQGLITTSGKFKSSYGYFEARLKMPIEAGPGTWPAFWTLSQGWPPEFDIVEYWGSNQRIHQGTATAKPDGGQRWDSYNAYDTSIAGWHTYGLEWGPGYQHYNIDGQITRSIYADYLAMPDLHYLLLNSGIETKRAPVAATKFPNDFEVDYARVYTRPGVPALQDGDFEMETAGPWQRNGEAVVLDYGAHSGARALRVSGDDTVGAMSQTIYGLKPNTRYTLSAQVKTVSGFAQLIARDFGGADAVAKSAKVGDYQLVSLQFTTGPQATSATIACEAKGMAFFDDVELKS